MSGLILFFPILQWDSVSRKWKEMENFVCSIKLLMVDEVCMLMHANARIRKFLELQSLHTHAQIHFIADEERGATLEAAVCRMKSISTWRQQQQVLSICYSTSSSASTSPYVASSLLRVISSGRPTSQNAAVPAAYNRSVSHGAKCHRRWRMAGKFPLLSSQIVTLEPALS